MVQVVVSRLVDAVTGVETVEYADIPVDPNVARDGMQLSRRQVIIGMVDQQFITEAEGIALAKDGTPPAAIETLLQAMPATQQIAARITLATFTVAYRLDPMVALFQTAGSLTDEQMDGFFLGYAGI